MKWFGLACLALYWIVVIALTVALIWSTQGMSTMDVVIYSSPGALLLIGSVLIIFLSRDIRR